MFRHRSDSRKKTAYRRERNKVKYDAEKKDSEMIKQFPMADKYKMIQGKATVYICENHICDLPVNSLEGLQKKVEVS